MKKMILINLGTWLLFSLAGCTLSLIGSPTPLVLPTLTIIPASQTALPPSATPVPLTVTATMSPPVFTPVVTIVGVPGTSGAPSGPYGVILVPPGDVLNIRSGPGVSSPVIGSFSATANDVMHTGASLIVNGELWVQVQNPSGGNGWVNSMYLTEYFPPVEFCADADVKALIARLGKAFINSDGEALAAMVSPIHGMDARLWRYGNVINYDREHSRWIFTSAYKHNWGPDGASGLDTIGSFQEALLPRLQEVFNASYTLGCNDPAIAGSFSVQPWPAEYVNINYYNVLKPGTPGIDLDFRIWLVGIEFVQGQPYIFSLIHFQWEP